MKVLCVAFYAMKVAGQSGSCQGTGACSIDGSSTTYTETISGTVRQIRSSGCPNNNPVDVCVGANPNPANTQDWQFDIPATPQFNSATYEASLTGALSLQELGGIIGITRNGIEIRSCYGGNTYGICNSYSTSATAVEGDTFEYCRGHGNPYHYHEAPVCLLQQMGTRFDGSSPQVGWAADGFPIYGNLVPGGGEVKTCGAAGADAKYCMDICGGYYGEDYDDDFKYRYFMAGPNTIPSVTAGRSPARTLTEAEGYFPFAPLCLLGCGSVTAVGNDPNPLIGRRMASCGASASAGTVQGFSPTTLSGIITAYEPKAGTVGSEIVTTTGSSANGEATSSDAATSASPASPTTTGSAANEQATSSDVATSLSPASPTTSAENQLATASKSSRIRASWLAFTLASIQGMSLLAFR